MTEGTQMKWLEAGKALAADPGASIPCPSCGKNNLEVKDSRAGNIVERWISCPSCRAFNTIRLNRPI